jgi:3-dehydroquinate dehydratase-1/3-dehydroquinate dehydratase/shikimate dehydrogenase
MKINQRGLICVAVAAASGEGVLTAVTPVLDLVDVVEIRLDALIDPRIEPCIAALAKPVLVTNRPSWEGGAFSGSEEDRLALLCRGLEAGARYVDIELRAELTSQARILSAARSCGAQVLISSHDFATTPSPEALRATLHRMVASGADIGKIVTTACSPGDALRILALQEEAMAAAFPLCAFAMGAAGTISRLATLYLGGFMTYAALSPEQATAPGQITVHDLHRLLSLLETTP